MSDSDHTQENESIFATRLDTVADQLYENCESIVILAMSEVGEQLYVHEINRGNIYTCQSMAQSWAAKIMNRLSAEDPEPEDEEPV